MINDIIFWFLTFTGLIGGFVGIYFFGIEGCLIGVPFFMLSWLFD